jgi:PBSX family phage terminase large subunit
MIEITATGPQYEFLRSPARYRAFIAGVGSGKTYAGVLASLVACQQAERGAIVAPTYPMLKDVVLPTFRELAEDGIDQLNKADLYADMTNGNRILFRSADKPERLRGMNLGWCWVDEAALIDEETWDILLGRLRLDPGRAWLTTTPKGHNWVYDRFIDDPGEEHETVRASTRDNPHLPDTYIESLEEQYTERFRRQEMEGEFVEAAGALWSWEHIERTDAPPTAMDRIVVGVDPAGGGPDEVGIVAVGTSGERAYVLRDASMQGSPNAWANAVVSVYNDLSADRVVAEKNFGGDMVSTVLKSNSPNLPVEMVNASRGKQQRIEPVAALYEQGKVRHVGTFDRLETQMTTWDPAEDDTSPDRVDALVWALTELMLDDNRVFSGQTVTL